MGISVAADFAGLWRWSLGGAVVKRRPAGGHLRFVVFLFFLLRACVACVRELICFYYTLNFVVSDPPDFPQCFPKLVHFFMM